MEEGGGDGRDERDARAQGDGGDEDYESLDDIVEEGGREQEVYESLDDVVREVQGESAPREAGDGTSGRTGKTSLDLTDEIGEVVASINDDDHTATEEISFGSAAPEGAVSRDDKTGAAVVGPDGIGEPRFSVDDRLKPFVRLLTSL